MSITYFLKYGSIKYGVETWRDFSHFKAIFKHIILYYIMFII